jgi:hypothetical protein
MDILLSNAAWQGAEAKVGPNRHSFSGSSAAHGAIRSAAQSTEHGDKNSKRNRRSLQEKMIIIVRYGHA